MIRHFDQVYMETERQLVFPFPYIIMRVISFQFEMKILALDEC